MNTNEVQNSAIIEQINRCDGFPWESEPYRTWSLFEMFEANASEFVMVMDRLRAITHMVIQGKNRFMQNGGKAEPDARRFLRGYLKQIQDSCQKIGASATANQAKLFEDSLRQEVDWSFIDGLSNGIFGAFWYEMRQWHTLILDEKDAKLHQDRNALFGKGVYRRFKSAAYDMVEAGKCQASGRSTACVFHLMRVMEAAIRAWSRKLGITVAVLNKTGTNLKDQQWHQLQEAIQKKVVALPRVTPADKRARQRQMAALACFDAIREAWRNPTMHPQEKYTVEESAEVLQTVAAFMNRLATAV